MMRLVLAALGALACAGCASTNSSDAGNVSLRQKTEVECVASNFEPSGCKTGHELWIVAPLSQGDGGLPNASDLRDPKAGTEF